ncbi:MAG: nucleotidyltransferase domain-containing protein [Bacillota bacterium]
MPKISTLWGSRRPKVATQEILQTSGKWANLKFFLFLKKWQYLVGSYAKGTATEDSDIDLAIDSSNLHGLWGLLRFEEDVSRVLGKPVDVLTLRAIDCEKNNPIKREFLTEFIKERICLYEQGY